jgi:hypothetical protein
LSRLRLTPQRSEDAAARFLADFSLSALVDALAACAPGSEVCATAAASLAPAHAAPLAVDWQDERALCGALDRVFETRAGAQALPAALGVASAGTGLYVEAGLDWQTGLWGLTLGGRLAHQMIGRPANFGVGNYSWWGVNLSRDFTIEALGTLTATLSYVQTSIARDQCEPISGRGQDICGARALASLGFRF